MKSRIVVIVLIILLIAMASAGCVERQFDNPLDERNPATGGKPTGLKATVTGIGEVTLSWDPIETPLVDRWNVYRSADGQKFDLIAQPTTNTYTDTGLSEATTYYYTVSADIGEKRQSDPISVTILYKDMVYVPAGNFTIGSDSGGSDEQPVHTVYLDAYYIDKYEVTNAQFAQFLSAGNSSHYNSSMRITQSGSAYTAQSGYENHPVVYVDWNVAKAYCKWVGKRLPTEAEWEKAARGTDGRTYPWGEGIDGTRANYCDVNCAYSWKDSSVNDGYAETAPVGSYPAGVSPYGAYDMAGNVWEWVTDWYSSAYYSSSPSSNPQGPSSGTYRVLRGGSWFNVTLNLRVAYRLGLDPSARFDGVGFRCAHS
jgi:formylglycine-generating enzyme required for sulfatase activity